MSVNIQYIIFYIKSLKVGSRRDCVQRTWYLFGHEDMRVLHHEAVLLARTLEHTDV